ncbi:hypothetical protein VCHENC02_3996B, partial [Vibrio harveyi]
ASWKKCATIA